MKLVDKTILVTGASSGIGRAVAKSLSYSNNNIVITARRENLLQMLAKEIEANGSRCLIIATDALDEQAASDSVQQVVAEFGSIDVALFNIGDGPSFNMSTTTADAVKQNMQLNYDSMVNYLIPVIQQMKQQKEGLIAHTNFIGEFSRFADAGPLFCG